MLFRVIQLPLPGWKGVIGYSTMPDGGGVNSFYPPKISLQNKVIFPRKVPEQRIGANAKY
jgi:hypothetical protein